MAHSSSRGGSPADDSDAGSDDSDNGPIVLEPETDPAVLAQLARRTVDLSHLNDGDWEALLSADGGAARCARLKASMQRLTEKVTEKPASTRQMQKLKRCVAMRGVMAKVSLRGRSVCTVLLCTCIGVA
jgi:hypothetical protein